LEQLDGGNLRRLPPGSHGIPADVVARNQRERLVAAMAEACAERGYAETSVADVAKRAGVSSATFYKQFADRRDCMLAAHRQLLGRLLEEIDRALVGESGEEAKTRAATGATLGLLAADPPSARLLTVEILAVGSEGSKRHDAAVEAFARRLRPGRPAAGDAPLTDAEWARAAGILALIGKRVMAGEAAGLPELADALKCFVS
jgi:AcrR family transcriptional regulator